MLGRARILVAVAGFSACLGCVGGEATVGRAAVSSGSSSGATTGGGGAGGSGGAAPSAAAATSDLVAAGEACQSPQHRGVVTLGQSPGGNGVSTSPKYRFQAGVVGAAEQ